MRNHTLVFLLLLIFLTACAAPAADTRETVRIAMPAPGNMADAEGNYYKRWLEDRTGLRIELELVSPDYMAEYMRLLLNGSTVAVDAVFFDPGSEVGGPQEVAQWGAEGQILPLEAMIRRESSYLNAFAGSFAPYDLYRSLMADDGHIYYMPNLQYSNVLKSAQTMWLNSEWLRQTGTPMPQTTEDFRAVLRTFLRDDPNGNGKPDELPVVFCAGTESQMIVNYLMNAFVYCDPANAYMAVAEGEVFFAPMTEQWRQGLIYCRELYEEGLLPAACMSFSQAQLVRAVSDPRDLVGGFVSADIADVIPQSSPETMNRYTHIAPLSGPDGFQQTWVSVGLPKPGGVIMAGCQNPEAVFALMDLMLSEEAYLIAAFGERDVDWKYSEANEVGLSGAAARITVMNREWASPPGKNFSAIGPFITYPEYADNVAWSGYQSDQRYLNARAARVYLQYMPDEYIPVPDLGGSQLSTQKAIAEYAREMMLVFITGEGDIRDDAVWRSYLGHCDRLGVDKLLLAAQESYNSLGGGGEK